jgi:hypothetical protein
VIETIIQLKNVGLSDSIASIVTGEAILRIDVNLKIEHRFPMTQELKAVGTVNPSNNVKGLKGTPIRVGP